MADLFPATRLSAVHGVKSLDPEERQRAIATLAAAYFRPVYLHVRLKWKRPPEDAADLAQSFFVMAVERDLFAAYDRDKGRFRTFVRACLDRLLAKDHRDKQRMKRGGGAPVLSADEVAVEAEVARLASADDVDDVFDREWARGVVSAGVASLRAALTAAGKDRHLAVFERYELADPDEQPSYQVVADALGIKVTDVTNSLFYARKELRRHILETLRAVTGSEEEYRDEAEALLGVDV